MVLISVIIPAFNAEKTIVQTVQSVLTQSLDNLEVIVIEDGSTDGAISVLSQIQDPRLRVVQFPNEGVAASINRGIQQAHGEYISFLDADYLWITDKLKEQYKSLKAQPEAAVVYSWVSASPDSQH